MISCNQSDEDDDSIMALCAGGRQDALQVLWHRYQSNVFNYALKVLGDAQGADEARQATFTALWRLSPRYEAQGRFKAYLMRVARTETREVRKRRTRWWSRVIEDPSIDADERCALDDSCEVALVRRQRCSKVVWALGELPEAHREAITLRYFSEMSYDDIADVMERPEGTVRSLVFHGHKKLDRILRKAGV